MAASNSPLRIFKATRHPASAFYAAARVGRYLLDLAVHQRGMQLVNGNALVARLLRSAVDLGVQFIDSAPARELIRLDDRVIGARLEKRGDTIIIHTARGVVLAAGGFPHDPARLDRLASQAGGGKGHYSAAPAGNSGDGLTLAETVGGVIADDLRSAVALAPPGGGNPHCRRNGLSNDRSSAFARGSLW